MKRLLVFLAFVLCAFSPARADETLPGDLTGQPTFTRASSVGYSINCNAPSGLSGPGRYYMVFDIHTTQYEPIQAYITLGTLSDSYIFLYCAEFDPNQPQLNLVAANDDINFPLLHSAFVTGQNYYIQPYTHYQLVVTTFGTNDQGTFTLTLQGNAHFGPPTLNIEATASAGGAISPSGTVSVMSGTDQTFTMTADTGYHGLDLIIDGTSVGYKPRYTFENVVADHTIHAVFIKSEVPVLSTFTATPRSGLAPLMVQFEADAFDPDGGSVEYHWDFDGNGTTDQITSDGTVNHRYVIPGEFEARVTIMDEEAQTITSDSLLVNVAPASRVHLPLLTDNTLTKRSKLGPGFHAATWVINRLDETASISLRAVNETGETISEVIDLVPALGKTLLSTSAFDGLDYAEIIAEPDRYVIATTEVFSADARMAAHLRLPLTSRLVVPHIAEAMTYWNTSAFITNDYLDKMNLVIGNQEINLTPEHTKVWDIGTLVTDNMGQPDDGDMWGTFHCEAGNPFSDTRMMGGFEMFVKNGSDGAALALTSDGSTSLYIPHIPTNTDIFWTGFAFVNPGPEAVTATVVFYTDEGDAAGTGEITVPAGKKLKGLMADLFPDAHANAAWGIVHASDKLVGLELYGTDDGICGFPLEGNTIATGSFPLMIIGEGLWTGIALANPNASPATVIIELVAEDGTIVGAQEATLAPFGRFSFVATDYFDRYNLRETDYIRFRSAYGLIGVEACGDTDRTFMTAVGAGY